MLLHGCTQNAAGYFANSGWQKFADQWRFALIVAAAVRRQPAAGCFNWFVERDITRGSGEALSIRQMVDHAGKNYGTDAAPGLRQRALRRRRR